MEAIILYSNTIVTSYMQVRVETRSGYLGCPGHVLAWLRGFHPLYKISRSDLYISYIGLCILIMASSPDKNDELSMVDSDGGSVFLDSPHDQMY